MSADKIPIPEMGRFDEVDFVEMPQALVDEMYNMFSRNTYIAKPSNYTIPSPFEYFKSTIGYGFLPDVAKHEVSVSAEQAELEGTPIFEASDHAFRLFVESTINEYDRLEGLDKGNFAALLGMYLIGGERLQPEGRWLVVGSILSETGLAAVQGILAGYKLGCRSFLTTED